jgi:hypothetical protein
VQVSNLQIEDSPRARDFLRCSVGVSYQSRLARRDVAWFEVPRGLANEVNHSGDPWLISLLPLATTLRESLTVDLPVDGQLLSNAQRLMGVWCTWYPELSPIELRAQSQADEAQAMTEPGRTALYFSGGVDSFYTLIHANQTGLEKINDLIYLHGFDIPIDDQPDFERGCQQLSNVADSFGMQLVPLATNLRRTRLQVASWSDLTFGCLLAGAGLMLAPRYRRILISSGLSPGHLVPHGSHPETDGLFSTTTTAFYHYAPEVDRIEKIKYLAAFPIALDNLRVCFESGTGDNCGKCRKCMAVMAGLELAGAAGGVAAFGGRGLDLKRLRTVYLSQGINTYRSLEEQALKKGRQDIAQAIESAFRRTALIDRWLMLGWVRRTRAQFRHHPGMRQSTRWLRPWLFRVGRMLNRLIP